MTTDEKFMLEALKEAKKAYSLGEAPVGAVVVRNGAVIGRGYNRRETDKNAVRHAEINAIEEACKNAGGWRLWDCTLYVTLEPCPMCAGAAINSRIKEVVFGAFEKKSGSCKSVVDLFALPYNHKPAAKGGVLEKECAAVLSDFFKSKRDKKNIPQKQGIILELDSVTPGGEAVVQTLYELKKNCLLFLIGSRSEDAVKKIFNSNDVNELFDGISLCKNDSKDKTDAIRMTVRCFGLKKAIFVGCSDSDRAAAQTAGIEFVHAAYSDLKVKAPTRAIKAFPELIELQEDILA